jgi:hypothetical protein
MDKVEAEIRALRNLWQQLEEWRVDHSTSKDRDPFDDEPEDKEERPPTLEELQGAAKEGFSTHDMFYADAQEAAIQEGIKQFRDAESAALWEKAWQTGNLQGLRDQLDTVVKLLREWATEAKIKSFDSGGVNQNLRYYLRGFDHAATMIQQGPATINMLKMMPTGNRSTSRRPHQPRDFEDDDDE